MPKGILNGKVALITGGARGIGEAIARRFVADGAKVVISDIQPYLLDRVSKSMKPGTVATCAGDVTNLDDVKRMVDTAMRMEGRFEVLVNNAGITGPMPVAEVDPAIWRQVIEVNLIGPFLTMHTAIPHFVSEGRGSIINMGSVGGIRAIPSVSAYCASKAGLIHLSKQVALDYGSKGIRCNVVCPGWVRTDLTEHEMDFLADALGTNRDGAARAIAKNIPVGRIALPKDIAGIFVYLASDESAYVTGAEIVVDGGGSVMDPGTMIFRNASKSAVSTSA